MNTALIVLLVLLVLLLMIGVPVGFAIGGATMVAMFYCSDLNMVVNAQYCYSGIFSFTVMAIPFFMLAGSGRFSHRSPGLRIHAGVYVLRRPVRLRHGHHRRHRRHDDP